MNQLIHKARKVVLLLALLYTSGVTAQISDKNYKIYSVSAGKEVTLEEIAKDMKSRDVLFFGEEHNDSVTHYLQAKLLEILYSQYGASMALSLEMFDRDVQTVMDEYLAGSIREKHFNKDARVWSNYRDYKPMVEFAKKNNLRVICANAPSRYTNLAGRKGQKALAELPAASKNYFAPLPYDTAQGPYYEKLQALSSHTPAPPTSNPTDTSTAPAVSTAAAAAPAAFSMGDFNLIVAQSLWDATMAYSISEFLKANKGKKVMHVNGRFHSDEGFAVATQLKKYSPKAKTLIISAGSDDSFPNIDWSKHKHLGDFIIITDPSVPRTYEQ